MQPRRPFAASAVHAQMDWARQSRARARDMMGQISAPAWAYVQTESASSLLLLAVALAGLLIANSR